MTVWGLAQFNVTGRKLKHQYYISKYYYSLLEKVKDPWAQTKIIMQSFLVLSDTT